MLHIAMATHSLKGTFDKSGPQNQWWRHCDVISQSISTKFCIFVCFINRHLCAKFEQNRTRNKEVAKNGKWRHCDVISKNSSAIFCVWVIFTHTYCCTKFQVDWRSDKGITGGWYQTPPSGLRMTKKARAGYGWTLIKLRCLVVRTWNFYTL